MPALFLLRQTNKKYRKNRWILPRINYLHFSILLIVQQYELYSFNAYKYIG